MGAPTITPPTPVPPPAPPPILANPGATLSSVASGQNASAAEGSGFSNTIGTTSLGAAAAPTQKSSLGT